MAPFSKLKFWYALSQETLQNEEQDLILVYNKTQVPSTILKKKKKLKFMIGSSPVNSK